MVCRAAYLFEILPCLGGNIGIAQCDIVQTYDSVHRRAYLMAHTRQENSLCLACFLGCGKSVTERLIFFKRLSHFAVNVGEAYADSVNDMVIPVLGVTHARYTKHFIAFVAVMNSEITIGKYKLLFKPLSDVFGLDEFKKSLTVAFHHPLICVYFKSVTENKLFVHLRSVAVNYH